MVEEKLVNILWVFVQSKLPERSPLQIGHLPLQLFICDTLASSLSICPLLNGLSLTWPVTGNHVYILMTIYGQSNVNT